VCVSCLELLEKKGKMKAVCLLLIFLSRKGRYSAGRMRGTEGDDDDAVVVVVHATPVCSGGGEGA
jgi:hypothetical protein